MYLPIFIFDYLLSCFQMVAVPVPFSLNQFFYCLELPLAEVHLLFFDLSLD